MALSIKNNNLKNGNYPLCVAYVEVNNANLLNAGCYELPSGENFFDIAIIFASSINYDTLHQRAYLYHNENVTKVLSNLNIYVRPLQQKGIKVLLSILGMIQIILLGIKLKI
jgi:hypothetical protein